MSESVILCEGYHDRAFWAGWLTRMGCTDPGAPKPGKKRRTDILDPWKEKVVGGQFAYHSASGQFVRIIPCQGKGNILHAARNRLQQRVRKPLTRLVVNIDPDIATGTPGSTTGMRLQGVLNLVQTFDAAATINAVGEIDAFSGGTKIGLIRWETNDLPAPGLPDQQTLERLVCAALIEAYPARAKVVQDWLDARPVSPPSDPKEHAWSFMAGWYAEHGCEFFYSNLWNDPSVVAALEARLRPSGAWQIAEKLAQ